MTSQSIKYAVERVFATDVINGGPTIDVQSPPFTEPAPPLTVNPDASNTYSPVGNNPLTFSWTTSAAGVTITGGNTSKPSIALPAPGIYVVTLTVTDSKGNVTSQVVVIDWQFNKH